MKFTVGDKILIRRTNEEGTVIAILSATMMEVEVGGVQFPVYTDEVDHPYLKWFTEKKKAKPRPVSEIPVEKVKERAKRLAQGIYISFMPVYMPDIMEDQVAHFRIYFLNETAATVHFIYEVKSAKGQQLFHHRASLHAFGNVYLHTLSLEEMNEQPRFNWLIGDDAPTLLTSDNKGQLRIKPSKLFERITSILQSGDPSFAYLLSDDIPGLLKAKPKPINLDLPEPPKQGELPIDTGWQPIDALDLHIEELVNDYDGLSPAEILNIQLQRLEYTIDMAIVHHQQRLMVIHGVGTGALKAAVHGLLSQKEGVASYRNEWFGKYGYGATEVIFK